MWRAGCPVLRRRYSTRAQWSQPKRANQELIPTPWAPTPVLPDLALPPESTAPLVDSDFPQYLAPLYGHGWEFMISRPTHGQGANALHRVLRFPTHRHLVAFTEGTRSVSGGTITVFPNYDADVYLQSPQGVTRSLIRLAVETETAYLTAVGASLPGVPFVKPFYKVMSLDFMHFMTSQLKITDGAIPPRCKKVLVPPERLRLPPAPPLPSTWPRPPLVKRDLREYLAKLVYNGWAIMPLKTTAPDLNGLPSLYRAYYFRDYATAREFFHMVVSRLPAPTPGSEEGVEVRLVFAWTQFPYKVCLWSISELSQQQPIASPPVSARAHAGSQASASSSDTSHRSPSEPTSPAPAPARYGISHADIRFALLLESEVIAHWNGRAERGAFRNRWIPAQLDQLRTYRPPREVGEYTR